MKNQKKESIVFTLDTTTKWNRKPTPEQVGFVSNKLQTTHTFNSVGEFAKYFVQPYGYAWCPAVFTDRRKNKNWSSQQLYALDFDSGITPQEAITKLKQVGLTPNVIYTSFSDSKELRKFRVIFVLDTPIDDKLVSRKLTIALLNVFNNVDDDTADKACSDFSRMYFGGKQLLLSNDDLTVTGDFINKLFPYFPTMKEEIKRKPIKKVKDNHTATIDKVVTNVDIEKAHSIAYGYTKKQNIDYVDGSRNLFITTYCGMMNQFGVDYYDMLEVISKVETLTTDSEIRAENVYNTYSDQFGTKSVSSQLYDIDNNNYDYVLEEGQKLTDLNIDSSTLDKVVLVSPTGSGKTYYVQNLKGKKIIVVPTRTLSDEIAIKYNGKAFNEDNKDVTEVDDFIAVTYASYDNLSNNVDISNYHVFLDESHNFTSSASSTFMGTSLNNTLESLKNNPPKRVTMLTATPIQNADEYLNSFDVVNVQDKNNKKKTIKIIKANDRSKFIQDIFKTNKKKNIFTACLLNNTKGELDRYTAILSNFNIQTYSASQKTEDHFVELISSGKIQNTTDGIFSTTVLKEGNSFDVINKQKATILILGKFGMEEIEQFSARFRNIKEVEVIIVRPDHYEDEVVYFNSFDAEATHISNALYNSQHFNAIVAGSINSQDLNKVTGLLKNTLIRINSIGLYEPDYLQISNAVYEEQKTIVWKDSKLLFKQAEKYGYTSEGIKKFDKVLTKTEKNKQINKVKEGKELREAKKQAIMKKVIEEGLDKNIELVDTRFDDKVESDVRFKLNIIYGYVKEVPKVVDIFNEVSETTQSWNTFIKQIQVAKVSADDTLKNRDDYKMIEATKKLFKVGEQLTSQQILDRIKKMFNDNVKYKSSDIITKTKALKFLSSIYKVEGIIKRNKDGKNMRINKIVSTNPLPFDFNFKEQYNNNSLVEHFGVDSKMMDEIFSENNIEKVTKHNMVELF